MSTTEAVIKELRDAGFTVLTRDQWGSAHEDVYQTRRRTRAFLGPASHAFAHITVTNDDGPFIGEFKADCREVERIGMDRFGTGVSYNWMVDQDTGAIAVGQPLDAAGAHTLNDKKVPGFPENLNYWGHAIAWIGVPTDSISDKAIDAFAAIIAAEKKHGAMERGARLYPHSKFAYKDCPCNQVRDKIDYIEGRVLTILEEDEMTPEDRKWLDARFDRLDKRLGVEGAIRPRLKSIDRDLDSIAEQVSDDASRQQVKRVRKGLADLIGELDEPDAPAEEPSA